MADVLVPGKIWPVASSCSIWCPCASLIFTSFNGFPSLVCVISRISDIGFLKNTDVDIFEIGWTVSRNSNSNMTLLGISSRDLTTVRANRLANCEVAISSSFRDGNKLLMQIVGATIFGPIFEVKVYTFYSFAQLSWRHFQSSHEDPQCVFPCKFWSRQHQQFWLSQPFVWCCCRKRSNTLALGIACIRLSIFSKSVEWSSRNCYMNMR